MLVVRAGVTSKPAIHDAIAAIDAGKLLGVVLERSGANSPSGPKERVMQVFNRQVSARGLTVFGFETILISGSILVGGAGSRLVRHGGRRAVEDRARDRVCASSASTTTISTISRSSTPKSELLVRVLRGGGRGGDCAGGRLTLLLPSLHHRPRHLHHVRWRCCSSPFRRGASRSTD